MADFEPRLRPIEPAPLTPPRERRRRGHERPFELERELAGERREPKDEPAPCAPETPRTPRSEDGVGGRLDVSA